MNQAVLRQENCVFRGTGGISQENQNVGFRPALLDADTGIVYPSRFANGQPAPVHLLDGLPEETCSGAPCQRPSCSRQTICRLRLRAS